MYILLICALWEQVDNMKSNVYQLAEFSKYKMLFPNRFKKSESLQYIQAPSSW